MTSEDGFGTVVIVGVGLIGGSLGMALRRYGWSRNIVGVGRDPERLDKAVKLGAINSYTTNLAAACEQASVVVLCTPVARIIADLPLVLANVGPDAVVTDVGSVKSAIVAAANDDPRFIGSHPMAGSEATGVEAARITLFQDATWAITPVESTSARAIAVAEALGRGVNAAVHTLTPATHDAAVATTSHLPHVMATALMRVASTESGANPILPVMSAGSFNDATRVAASSPDLWRDICLSNSAAVINSIDALSLQLEEARARIEAGDAEALREFFAAGERAKRGWRSPTG